MLEGASLGPEEEAVYLAILDKPSVTQADISRMTGIIDPDIALKQLCGKGFITRVCTDEGVTYEAVDPAVVLRAELATLERRLESLRDAERRLCDRYHASRAGTVPREMVEYIPVGVEAIRRVERALDAATSQIWAVTTGPWSTPGQGIRSGTEAEREAIERGVSVRVIYDRRAVEQPGRLEDLWESARMGEHSRVLPFAPFLFFLIDPFGPGAAAALPVASSGLFKDAGGLVIRQPWLIAVFVEWYESLWERAIPLNAFDPRTGRNPGAGGGGVRKYSREERSLVGMLASGLTDKAIGRQLGVSDRTAQRRVAAVIQRLGAQTRFQAGVQATRQGLC